MAHSAVWSYFPIHKQNKNLKVLMEEKLSENGLSKYTKFGLAHLLFVDLVWDFSI